MLKIVLIMLCGIGTGFLLRNKKMSFLGLIITALIWVLLFLLGVEVGSNPRIIGGIQTLGLSFISSEPTAADTNSFCTPSIFKVRIEMAKSFMGWPS